MLKHIKTATGADSGDSTDIQASDWNDPHCLNIATGTDADTTMAVGTCYKVDMSAWATANRTYTLPATAMAGDQIAIVITAGNGSFELIVTAASGDTLNGVAGGTEWSRLFITGETVTFTCMADNATWAVTSDGRIPCKMTMRLTTATSGTETQDTWYAPTALNGVWTVDDNFGGCADAANSKFLVRRKSVYLMAGRSFPLNGLSAAGKSHTVSIWDGTNTHAIQQIIVGGAGQPQFSYSGVVTMLPDTYLQYRYRNSEANRYEGTISSFNVLEQL